MRWASAVSSEPELAPAVTEVTRRLREALGDAAPQLVLVFVSQHHAGSYDRVPELVANRFPSSLVLGCSAGAVIGGGREVEQRPGLSLTAAVLPDVTLHPFYLETETLPDVPEGAHLVLLPDPFTFDADRFVRALDEACPTSTKLGGLASGGRQPGDNALYLGRATHHGGLVGVALSGNVALDTIVAQGCRPIGEPMFVTSCQREVLRALDGRRPVEVLQQLYRDANERDRELFRHSLFLGIVMNEVQHEYRQGDFLIRNVIGLDPESGVIAIGGHLREGLVVQFHLRDARTSADDLEALLSRYQGAGVRPAGSLLFSCLGRGAHLYGEPDHDTGALRRHLGDVPLGGFFCNGEIGPVHGRTFLHGYTSAFGLFRPRD